MYPPYRSFYTNFFVNEAPNDYAQLLVETGLPEFAVMIWFLVIVYRRARSKIGDWTTNVSSATTLACSLGAIGILVHSFFDFNLQIPANAALFYGCALQLPHRPYGSAPRKRRIMSEETEEFVPASEVV